MHTTTHRLVWYLTVLSVGTATPIRLPAAEPLVPANPPVLMTPMTVYGGDYCVLPGAASLNVRTTQPVQGGTLGNTRDLMALAPNLAVFDANNNRMPRFSIRGLRENNFVTGDPAVGLYVDDVPCADLYSRSLPLHEVESIEFIRGPQGTLYGASGSAGVLNITSRLPGNTWHGNAGFTYGSYDQQAWDAALGGPVVADQLGVAVSGLYSTRNGFAKNTLNGARLDDQETLAGRLHVRWLPSQPWQISLLASGQRFNDGFVPTYNPGTDQDLFHVARDYAGHVDTETWNIALKAAWEGTALKVTSVTSYRNWRQDLAQDFDFSATPVGATVGFFRPDREQWTEEIRMRSLDQDAPCKWNLGLYVTGSRVETASGRTIAGLPSPPFPPGAVDRSITTSTLDAQTYALFGDATYTLWEKLDLIGGLRLTCDRRQIDRARAGFNLTDRNLPFGPFQTGVFNTDEDYWDVQPKAGVAYHFQPECVMYATATRGYQSGGFNASNDNPAQSPFDPARSWNFEVGVRTLWLEQRLELNTAFFYVLTDDYQVFRLSSQDPAQAWMLNADRAVCWGAEAELTVRPGPSFALSLLGGYTQAEFDRFRDPFNGAALDGYDINFVPEFTASVAAEYRPWKGFYARAELAAVGRYHLDEANTVTQDAYALLHARVGYAHQNFEVFVFGRNLLDEEYAANALDFRPFSGLILQPGDPLTLGVGLSARF